MLIPPPFQSPLAQLATLGQRLDQMTTGQMATGRNLSAAVETAREALRILRSQAASSTDLRFSDPLQAIRAIEDRLDPQTPEHAEGLQRALTDLCHLIQSLGASPRPFLFLVQNAPDQRVRAPESSPLAGILRHWERGEHDRARELLLGLMCAARDGDARCLGQLGELIMSREKTVSVNAGVVADTLESIGWDAFALKIIDPSYPLLIPGFDPSRRNVSLLVRLLGRPPASAESIAALNSVLRKRTVQDVWSLRTHAAQGLFMLTTPEYGAMLPVFEYWSNIIRAWPVPLPALLPSRFGPSPSDRLEPWRDLEPRWDLYEGHMKAAFSVAENAKQPMSLRREAAACVWNGYAGPDSAPKPLWTVNYFRARGLVNKEPDMIWLQDHLRTYERDSGVSSETERPVPVSSPAAEPLRLLGELTTFARTRARHLRLVPRTPEQDFGRSPLENIKRLADVAGVLASYGLHLEAPLIGHVMKTALESALAEPGLEIKITSEPVASFRRNLYALNPAAAVTGWLDATGLPWPSQDLPEGHRPEGALALLQWIRDREREPEEIKGETARRYRELNERLIDRSWSPLRLDNDRWWEHRLSQELPALLANQIRDARQTGAPHAWLVHARRHPEIEADLKSFLHSPLPGTRAFAERILQILSARPSSGSLRTP
jgi:hypothetical protein